MKLLTNIRQLLRIAENSEKLKRGSEMSNIAVLEKAFLAIKDDKIVAFGEMKNLKYSDYQNAEIIDCSGRIVLPGFVDSHTHIIFADTREGEFVDKINGLTYEEIAKRGGGILNSAQKLAKASEDDLYNSAKMRLHEMINLGTTAVEIKSGYGLSVESELKMLRVAKKLKNEFPIDIKITFLGAHAFPKEYKDDQQKYIDLIINEMLPKIAEENLADYVDVFCDRGFFTEAQTGEILEAAAKYDLKPKIHANELDYSGGVQVGVKYNAISVDHLECVGNEEISTLLNSQTMPTVLPSTAFYLTLHFAPARQMIEAGLPVAIASDYNPGSSPSGNMSFVISLACIKMKMTPEEAICAATLNAAYALELSDSQGSIELGKKANLIITEKINSFYNIPYFFGRPHIKKVMINGKFYSN